MSRDINSSDDKLDFIKFIQLIEGIYGSFHSYKILKYFLEHYLARKYNGFASYEICFNIPPSSILLSEHIIQIECRADDSYRRDAENGLNILLENGVLKIDRISSALFLNKDINHYINIKFLDNEDKFIIVTNGDDYDGIIFPVSLGADKIGVYGVPDLIYKGILHEIKPQMLPLPSRTYPPIWCKNIYCKECDFLICDNKILDLFRPYMIYDNDFSAHKNFEITTLAIYLGYCKRLGKYALKYTQEDDLPIINANFINHKTGKPTRQSIQRIFLDMLNRIDTEAPTNEIHKIRLYLLHRMSGGSYGKLLADNKEIDLELNTDEEKRILELCDELCDKIINGENIDDQKTEDLTKCQYCFLTDCNEI